MFRNINFLSTEREGRTGESSTSPRVAGSGWQHSEKLNLITFKHFGAFSLQFSICRKYSDSEETGEIRNHNGSIKDYKWQR